jgi:hypothetical protein
VPSVPLPRFSVCRCGHRREAHQHYRPGSDCASCACRRFLPRLLGRGSGEDDHGGDHSDA